jgi:hypothetical protein
MHLKELWRNVVQEQQDGPPMEGCQYVDHVASSYDGMHLALKFGEDYTYEVRTRSGQVEFIFTVVAGKIVNSHIPECKDPS